MKVAVMTEHGVDVGQVVYSSVEGVVDDMDVGLVQAVEEGDGCVKLGDEVGFLLRGVDRRDFHADLLRPVAVAVVDCC